MLKILPMLKMTSCFTYSDLSREVLGKLKKLKLIASTFKDLRPYKLEYANQTASPLQCACFELCCHAEIGMMVSLTSCALLSRLYVIRAA